MPHPPAMRVGGLERCPHRRAGAAQNRHLVFALPARCPELFATGRLHAERVRFVHELGNKDGLGHLSSRRGPRPGLVLQTFDLTRPVANPGFPLVCVAGQAHRRSSALHHLPGNPVHPYRIAPS